MSTALMVQDSQAVAPLWDDQQVRLIKSKIAKNIPDDEFLHFTMICRRSGLDPFFKQIYAIERGGKWTVQTGIDGYRLIAQRTGDYAGSDDATYDTETAAQPQWARVTVYRFVQGQRCAFTAKARWSEYAVIHNGKPLNKWAEMPYLMLAKCAEALALRKAFPAELSSLYTSEEMEQADAPRGATMVIANKPTLADLQREVAETCKQSGIDKAALDDFCVRHNLSAKNLDHCRRILSSITDESEDHADLWLTNWALFHGLSFGFVQTQMAHNGCRGTSEQMAALQDNPLQWLAMLKPAPTA